jgi:hypothetical protein
MPIPVAVRSDRFVAVIVGSSPAYGMDVCRRISVFCPVQVEALATGSSLVQTSPTECLNKIKKPQKGSHVPVRNHRK